jgi:hypothetical protein
MVCPYKATTGLITAMMSILYISSTFQDPEDEKKKKKTEEAEAKKPTMSPARRMLLVTMLVLFHLDLFTTGYLRTGVKQLIGMKMN